MDADNSTQPKSSLGGTVEPLKRSAPARDLPKRPTEGAFERYELRDPMAELTYRSSRYDEIVRKAGLLGIDRITAIDSKGWRTPIRLVNGEWRHGLSLPPPLERPLDPLPLRDDGPDVADEATARTATPKRQASSRAEPEAARTSDLGTFDVKAERAANVARLEATLNERYLIRRAPLNVGDLAIGHTEYRFRGDPSRVAFTESTFRLATDVNSPSVARSMVDVAEARNWHTLRVAGNEDFRRLVWLEASVRGVRIHGYEPSHADIEALRRERETRQVNRIEPEREGARADARSAPAEEKGSTARGGGRKAVLAAIEALMIAKGVPEKQRAAVMTAATESLARRARDGQAPKVRVYDRSAPSQRPPTVAPVREVQRTRERTAPVR